MGSTGEEINRLNYNANLNLVIFKKMQTSCFQVMGARIIINNGKLIRKKTTLKKTKHFVVLLWIENFHFVLCFSIIVLDNDNEYVTEKNQVLYKIKFFLP